ncbi:MAG: copper homeostasis periplasmic binding protein CopC [Herminiimonas sp.]|nr:copper homeostasis periplasmic binding protein CopC [Herminiimonas sp.]
MNTYRNLFAFLLTMAALGQAPAWAHAALASADPASNAVLATSPTAITLHFNEKLEGAFSAIKVVDAAGRPLPTGKAVVDVADPKILHVSVPPLATGKYSVRWIAIGHDGHRRTGDYSFSVK